MCVCFKVDAFNLQILSPFCPQRQMSSLIHPSSWQPHQELWHILWPAFHLICQDIQFSQMLSFEISLYHIVESLHRNAIWFKSR